MIVTCVIEAAGATHLLTVDTGEMDGTGFACEGFSSMDALLASELYRACTAPGTSQQHLKAVIGKWREGRSSSLLDSHRSRVRARICP